MPWHDDRGVWSLRKGRRQPVYTCFRCRRAFLPRLENRKPPLTVLGYFQLHFIHRSTQDGIPCPQRSNWCLYQDYWFLGTQTKNKSYVHGHDARSRGNEGQEGWYRMAPSWTTQWQKPQMANDCRRDSILGAETKTGRGYEVLAKWLEWRCERGPYDYHRAPRAKDYRGEMEPTGTTGDTNTKDGDRPPPRAELPKCHWRDQLRVPRRILTAKITYGDRLRSYSCRYAATWDSGMGRYLAAWKFRFAPTSFLLTSFFSNSPIIIHQQLPRVLLRRGCYHSYFRRGGHLCFLAEFSFSSYTIGCLLGLKLSLVLAA